MRNFITFIAVCVTTGLLAAQEAPLDAKYLRTHAETRGFMLGRPVRAKPTPDGKAVLFLRGQAKSPRLALFEFDTATGKTRELLTPEKVLKGAEEKLTPEEKARRERMRVSSGGFADFHISPDSSAILLSLSGRLYVIQRANGEVRELKTGAGTILDPKFSPNGKYVSYVRDHDLYVYDLATDKEKAITTGGTEKKTHGLAEFVAQEEMNRFTGYWWSPDSRKLAYEEADADGVEIWYVADPAHPDQAAQPSFYPRPGKANVKVRLGIVPIDGGDTTWIEWDVKKYPYLGGVHWSEAGPLTITVQTRDQKELALLRVDPTTGKTTPLVVEKDPAWVNLEQDVPRWLADGSGFLWSSEQEGGPRLELRDKSGELRRVLVPWRFGYQGLADVDPKAGQAVFRASSDPTQTQLYRVSFDGGAPVALSKGPGIHGATFSRDHSLYVHQSLAAGSMPKTTVHRADGTAVGDLPSVAQDPPFVPKAELLTIGDAPGFHASIVRPRNFDAKLKYPVIVDVYGGPGHNRVLSPMQTRLLDQWLADQGFIVVSIDGRGTPGRGRDWERAIYKKFGSVPLDDQVAGLKALGAKFPEMDLERVGITGWSFGGYMSALAVLRRPDIFKAAVAGAPVTDWHDYDTHYTERYMGVPEKDDPAYKDGSLLTYAPKLERPLLLMHGTADDNVYFRHTLKLADALFRAGKDFEVLPLSGLTHMVPNPLVMERLWGRIAGQFQKHLGKPKPRGIGFDWRRFGEKLRAELPVGPDERKAAYVAARVAEELDRLGIEPNFDEAGRQRAGQRFGPENTSLGTCGHTSSCLKETLIGAGIPADRVVRVAVLKVRLNGKPRLELNADHASVVFLGKDGPLTFDLWMHGRAKKTFTRFSGTSWDGLKLASWAKCMGEEGYNQGFCDEHPQSEMMSPEQLAEKLRQIGERLRR
jgi:dipeptidyl-peptidase-4